MDRATVLKHYLRGIELFNNRQFFEAHEAWEDAWRPMQAGVQREFFQALIQCAVALEHYRRSNPIGVNNLYATYTRHFSDVPPAYMGLNVAVFQTQMRKTLAPVLDSPAPLKRHEITLDVGRVPRIDIDRESLEATLD